MQYEGEKTRGQENKKTRGQEDKKTRRQEDKKTRGQENERTRGLENERTRGREGEKTRGHINHRGFKAKNSCMSRFFDELCSQLFEGKTPASTEKNETMGSDPDVSF